MSVFKKLQLESILPPYDEVEVEVEAPADLENTQAFYRKITNLVYAATKEGNTVLVQRIRSALRRIQRRAEQMGFAEDMYYTSEYKDYLGRYQDYFEMVGDEDITPLNLFLEDCIRATRGESTIQPYPIVPDYQWQLMRDVEVCLNSFSV